MPNESHRSPAPWTQDPEGELAVCIEDANGEVFCEVYGASYDPKCEANCRLVTAAPDLLAACRDALNMLGAARDHCTGERGLVRRIDAAAKAAHDAIAKAEGKTSEPAPL